MPNVLYGGFRGDTGGIYLSFEIVPLLMKDIICYNKEALPLYYSIYYFFNALFSRRIL